MSVRAHLLVLALLGFSEGYLRAADVVGYREVRSILSDHCYPCHGPDAATRRTELRLDDHVSVRQLLDSGRPAIAAGDVAGSELYRRITSTDEAVKMPPPDSGKALTPDQVQKLAAWIQAGASWETHWSFLAPLSPTLPAVRHQDWPCNAIDYFVLARLERAGLTPAPAADPRTLARRATLSLTGLAPKVNALRQYLRSDPRDAYEQLVDQLLQSPRFGEHQARYWLDAARYGDTHGLHLDNERSLWRYRDWVIDAFNRNLPFDQFTIEQVAGDLLPNATLDQQIATGFHRCNVTTNEAGAIAEEFLARYAVDRAETTATVWMGLTAGCAACHDHKFDPLSQREFYQLYAYFYNLTENAMDGNALLPPPSVKAPTLVQQRQQHELEASLTQVQSHLATMRGQALADPQRWEPVVTAELRQQSPPAGHVMHLSMDDTVPASVCLVGSTVTVPGKIGEAAYLDGQAHWEIDGAGDFETSDRFSYGAWLQVSDHRANPVLAKLGETEPQRGYELYLDAGKVCVHLVHQWETNAIRVHTKLPLRSEKWHHVFVTYDGSSKARGVHVYVDGRPQSLEVTHDSLSKTIRTPARLKVGRRDATASFVGSLDDVRLYDRELSPAEILRLTQLDPLAMIVTTPAARRTEAEARQLVDHYLRQAFPESLRWFQREEELTTQLARLAGRFPSTLVLQERSETRTAHVLVRGQYDQPGEQVVPGVPQVFPPIDDPSESRLSLARWLVRADHPLTARVIVNRIWQQHFGVGLVKTSEDFGSQGELPSHPQLLDYLATELVRGGWDLKRIHRLIVTSATFRQDSRFRTDVEDPENRLLARGPRFRLDAEVIRDTALAAGNLLHGAVGGPSVKPYQPSGLWEAVAYPTSTTAKFRQDAGQDLYRRSLYTFWKRTSPPPSMQILDAPTREVCSVRRPRTNTPTAALLLLNDVQFVEAARKFAECLVANAADDVARFELAFEIALSRTPADEELSLMNTMLTAYRTTYAANPELANKLLSLGESPLPPALDGVEVAAWTLMASTLLNLDEHLSQH